MACSEAQYIRELEEYKSLTDAARVIELDADDLARVKQLTEHFEAEHANDEWWWISGP